MKWILIYLMLTLIAGVEGQSFEISVRQGAGQDIVLEWASEAHIRYEVGRSASVDGPWHALFGSVSGTGQRVQKVHRVEDASVAFLRVVRSSFPRANDTTYFPEMGCGVYSGEALVGRFSLGLLGSNRATEIQVKSGTVTLIHGCEWRATDGWMWPNPVEASERLLSELRAHPDVWFVYRAESGLVEVDFMLPYLSIRLAEGHEIDEIDSIIEEFELDISQWPGGIFSAHYRNPKAQASPLVACNVLREHAAVMEVHVMACEGRGGGGGTPQ